MRLAVGLLTTSLVLLLALPVGAPAETVTTLERSSPLSEHDGRVLLSRWDGAAYRLAVLRDGRVTDLPQVRPQSRPFDADLGPDSAGRPSLAVELDGDLYVGGIDPGDALRPVRNANTTGQDEHHPTVWRGRIAFVRGRHPKQVPYTKLLRARRSTPSTRLPALPATRCIAVDEPICRPIERAAVQELELVGERIAQSWRYVVDGGPGFVQNELRLTTTSGRDTRQLEFISSGLGGQSFVGLSIANGRVAWYVTCPGDPDGCRSSGGSYRYRISTGAYERDLDRRALGGWAWDGRTAFGSRSGGSCRGDGADAASGPSNCPVTRESLRWEPAPTPRPVR